MKKKISVKLKSGQIVSGMAFSTTQLGSKFQVWAKPYMSDRMSKACWIVSRPWSKLNDISKEEAEALAEKGFKRIKGIKIPEL